MEQELYEVLSTAWGESLPLDLASVVAYKMTRATIKKGAIILRPGEINQRLYFIQRGLMRAYCVKDGVEKTRWIKAEGEFVVSISSFWTQSLSIEYLHAIEDTDVFSISHAEFWGICRKHVEFAFIGLVHLSRVLVEWDIHLGTVLDLDVTERFEWFMEQHGHLMNRVPGVPGKYIASFLGMTPETFSKVKAKYFKMSAA
jgi:CRP/FNR family transcriptional regulator, anaerobic regulatory protein